MNGDVPGGIPKELVSGFGDARQAPQYPLQQSVILQQVAIAPGIGQKNMRVFLSQAVMTGKNLAHGLPGPPADADRFVIEAPHETPNHVARSFQIFIGESRHRFAHGSDRTPLHMRVRAVKEGKQSIDRLESWKPGPIPFRLTIAAAEQAADFT